MSTPESWRLHRPHHCFYIDHAITTCVENPTKAITESQSLVRCSATAGCRPVSPSHTDSYTHPLHSLAKFAMARSSSCSRLPFHFLVIVICTSLFHPVVIPTVPVSWVCWSDGDRLFVSAGKARVWWKSQVVLVDVKRRGSHCGDSGGCGLGQ